MKIAIDVSPLKSGHHVQHKVRGTGFYITHLLESLKREYPQHEFYEFFNKDKIPSRIDLIHIPYFEPFFFTLPFYSSRPTVVTVHDLTPLKLPLLFPVGIKGRFTWNIQKRLLKKMTRIITDSQSSKSDIKELAGLGNEKIDVIPLAAGNVFKKQVLRSREKERILKKYHLPEKYVLYVGDVTMNKNLPTLIEASLLTKVPLVMIGKALSSDEYDRSHPWNRDLKRVHELTHNNSLFHILGFVPTEDLVHIYNLASVFVLPSLYEGFGLPLIEAMSCGVPVITTKESSLPEVGGIAPVYVDYTSTPEFARQINRILRDGRLAEGLSRKSIEQAKKFSWKRTADETMRVYERMVSL